MPDRNGRIRGISLSGVRRPWKDACPHGEDCPYRKGDCPPYVVLAEAERPEEDSDGERSGSV